MVSINVRFSPQDWARIEHDWNAWWVGELERPLVVLEAVDPVPGADWSQLTKFGLDTPLDTILDNWQRILEATHFLGDSFPKWWPNFGPGTAAAFLGSRVSWASTDTSWFWPLEGIDRLSDLHLTYDGQNPWWLRVQEITRRAVARWGDRVVIGIADIGGNLDILAALRGSEKLLLDLTDASHEVERLVDEITALWIRYYGELEAIARATGRGSACWGPVWSPRPGYMLQCDFSYMISPRMFKRFVMPDLAACCEYLDYGFYHLDGIGELPHLDQLIGLERLRGIQWQPGDGQPKAEGWLEVIAKIRDSGKRCQIYVTRQGALAVQRELGGKGFLMHIVDDPVTVEEGEAFLKELFSV